MRKTWGKDYVTDVTVDGNIATYTVDPKSECGYIVEVDLRTGKERNCGLGRHCFWTDWEQKV